MSRGVYVVAATAETGKSLVTIGLVELMRTHADSVAFFRPLTATEADHDPLLSLVKDTLRLPGELVLGGMSRAEARALLAAGQRDELYRRCVGVYSELAAKVDVVIVDGSDFEDGRDLGVEFDLNTELANHLGAMVVAVVGGAGQGADAVVESVDLARKEVLGAGCSLAAIMVNRVASELVETVRESVHPGASGRPVYVLAEAPELSWPSVGEVVDGIGAHTVSGSERLDRDVRSVRVAAMTVEHFLPLLGDGALVITPGDRADILVATLASSLSATFPVPAAVLLTGGIAPHETIAGILRGAPFPVLALDEDTYSATRAVAEVGGELARGNPRKIAAALGVWARSVDADELVQRLALPRPVRMTPVRFGYELVQRAAAHRKRIVLPEGGDRRILRAAEILRRRDVCELVVLGEPAEVHGLAAAEGVDLTGVQVLDPQTSTEMDRFVAEYARLRAHKGVDSDRAREVMSDGSYFATMMVHLGLVDGMVSGAAHTTAHTIRPALEFIKTADGVSTVSSVFLMCLPDRVLAYGDCAVIPEPDAAQLTDIAIASADTAARFGIEPRVAMLSYSTGSSGSGATVEKVREATRRVRERRPDLPVEGPIQYDAAVNASIAASKLPGSAVAGQATVFIFPDLNTGNNTYKAVQQSAGALAIGPVLQGLRKPVNDLSRGATVQDIINTVVITAIQAQS